MRDFPGNWGSRETHQTLIQNGLRQRVRIETDGKLMSGRDVAIAAILGAEEFGFATAPLITMGCVMMRVCNLDTCPVGVATQNPELRKRFIGKPEYVINFMRFIAEELREYMAKLGVRSVADELVGKNGSSCPKKKPDSGPEKIDISGILRQSLCRKTGLHFRPEKGMICPGKRHWMKSPSETNDQGYGERTETQHRSGCRHTDRAFGTILGSEITRKFGTSLEDDTYRVLCKGAGGQSFGAFIPQGPDTLELVGDSNDYFGKGFPAASLIIYPPKSRFKSETISSSET